MLDISVLLADQKRETGIAFCFAVSESDQTSFVNCSTYRDNDNEDDCGNCLMMRMNSLSVLMGSASDSQKNDWTAWVWCGALMWRTSCVLARLLLLTTCFLGLSCGGGSALDVIVRLPRGPACRDTPLPPFPLSLHTPHTDLQPIHLSRGDSPNSFNRVVWPVVLAERDKPAIPVPKVTTIMQPLHYQTLTTSVKNKKCLHSAIESEMFTDGSVLWMDKCFVSE